MAHEIPYVATATVAELRDLEAKVQTRDGDPRRALPARLRPLPARLGQRLEGHDPDRAAGEGDRASSRCSRRATARSPASRRSAARCPVEEYLQPAAPLRAPVQARAADRRDRPHPGAAPTATSAASACSATTPRGRAADGQAVRDHARRRLEPAPTRPAPGATERPRLRPPPAAVQPRLPGRREHPAVALPRRVRRLRGGLARARQGQPAARRDGPRLLPPLRDRLQPRRSSTRPSGSTASSASSATRRSGAAGSSTRRCGADRQARAGRRRRSVGPVGRLPPGAVAATPSRSATPGRWPAA